MNLFFTNHVADTFLVLEDQEAQHCSRVLRRQVGSNILVMDGRGYSYEASITSIGRSEVRADIIKRTYHDIPSYPSIAFGLIKNTTRIEWLVEKVTEIGVSHITPLITARSERKALKIERLEKILISAAKQSLKYHLPIIQPTITFKDYIAHHSPKPFFVASYDPTHTQLSEYTTKLPPNVIIIGPEGDFAPDELQMAKNAGGIGVNLGSSRLRTETAAMVAITILNMP